jgi:hypothetical protein
LLGEPCELVKSWFAWGAEEVWDFNGRYETVIRYIFDNLPLKLRWLEKEYYRVIARGYIWKAIDATIWGNPEDARTYFAQVQQWERDLMNIQPNDNK